MRLNRLFIGKYEPISRPINAVNDSLIGRIQKARQELALRGKDVVSVRASAGSSPKAPPFLFASSSPPRESLPISDSSKIVQISARKDCGIDEASRHFAWQ